MARPKPTVLLEHVDSKTYKVEQILVADAIYAVFYKGQAINIKTSHYLISQPGPKYKKCSFSNAGHAYNLAEKLNEMFKTTEFEVYELTTGNIVKEHTNDSQNNI